MVTKTTSKTPAAPIEAAKKSAIKPDGKRPPINQDTISKRKPGGPGKVLGN